jgi:hypothetical protein
VPASAIKNTYELRPYMMEGGQFTLRETPEGPYRASEFQSPESHVAISKIVPPKVKRPRALAKSFQAPPTPPMDLPINGDHPNWPEGLPKTVRLDPGYSRVAAQMQTGTARMTATDATQANEDYYGPGHRWRINVDPHIDPAQHLVVPGREPDHPDPYVASKAQWYDRELAEAKPDEQYSSWGLGERHHVVPIVGKAEGWHEDIPAEKEGGYIYRGMSAGELRAAVANGGFASRGNYNIGDVQKGLTYFDDDPHVAASYATSFAPSGFKPTFGHPGYVVKYKNPGGDREVRLPHIPGEVGIRGTIPHHEIESVYEARPYAVSRGQNEIVSDGKTKDPMHLDGSGVGVSSSVLWREAHPSEFFGGPKPIQKSGESALDQQRLARTPWLGDRVKVNMPGRRDHGDTYTVGHVNRTAVTLHDDTGTPALQMSGEGWHKQVMAGRYVHTAPGMKPRRAGADFSQPIPPPVPRPRKEPPAPTDGPMSAADWESGQPGTYRGYRASRPQYMNTGAANGAVYVGHTGDDAAGYHTAGNDLHQVEFDVRKPFDIQAPGNAEALSKISGWNPKMTQAQADEYRRMGVMQVTPAQRSWLVSQGYDAVLTNPQWYPAPGVERAMALLHTGKLRTIKKIAHRDDVEAALRGYGKPAHAKQGHHYPMLVRDLNRELGKSDGPETFEQFQAKPQGEDLRKRITRRDRHF